MTDRTLIWMWKKENFYTFSVRVRLLTQLPVNTRPWEGLSLPCTRALNVLFLGGDPYYLKKFGPPPFSPLGFASFCYLCMLSSDQKNSLRRPFNQIKSPTSSPCANLCRRNAKNLRLVWSLALKTIDDIRVLHSSQTGSIIPKGFLMNSPLSYWGGQKTRGVKNLLRQKTWSI